MQIHVHVVQRGTKRFMFEIQTNALIKPFLLVKVLLTFKIITYENSSAIESVV